MMGRMSLWASWVSVNGPFEIPISSYPSGEPLISFSDSHYVRSLLLRPTSMTEFMGAMFFADALRERGHFSPDLVLPFVPGARQDRLNDEGDFLFTAKSIAREINLRNFESVTVLDPHSEVAAGMIDRCRIVHAAGCFARVRYCGPYQAVVSPDAGAEKRAGAVARHLGVPLLHAWKTRDVMTGKISGFGMEPFDDMNAKVLVVDDICDGGGTFVGLSEILSSRGVKADLYVTHGVFSKGTAGLLTRFGKIFCTDSIDAKPEDEWKRVGVEVIPICFELLERR
jgi:ribose-phosphate pyrophosphokinase